MNHVAESQFSYLDGQEEMLWFTAPPLSIQAKDPPAVPSLDYLSFMAEKLGY
jgi:hypothetical protein